MTELHVAYVGAAAYARRLAERLRTAGAEVRYDLPGVPGWDEAGQTHVTTTLRVRGIDEPAVRAVLSRFREYYPGARVSLGVPAP